MSIHPERVSLTTTVLKALGGSCIVGSIAAFMLATIVYVSGVEIAIFLHMASLAVFTFGIGALSVARDRNAAGASRTSATIAG